MMLMCILKKAEGEMFFVDDLDYISAHINNYLLAATKPEDVHDIGDVPNIHYSQWPSSVYLLNEEIHPDDVPERVCLPGGDRAIVAAGFTMEPAQGPESPRTQRRRARRERQLASARDENLQELMVSRLEDRTNYTVDELIDSL
ncbi:hypothetical protein HHB58_11145 [Neisseria meningitidis]|nr:hypothetical protein [Neisseria meningitidis]